MVFLICGAIGSGSVWCTRTSMAIQSLRLQVDKAVDGRWTAHHMDEWIERSNREAELWSISTEQRMGLEPGAYPRFIFPSARLIRDMESK